MYDAYVPGDKIRHSITPRCSGRSEAGLSVTKSHAIPGPDARICWSNRSRYSSPRPVLVPTTGSLPDLQRSVPLSPRSQVPPRPHPPKPVPRRLRPYAVLGLFAAVLSACGDDPVVPPAPGSDLGDWTALVSGRAHACALNEDSSVWCWGDNTWGQFGDATTTSSALPVQAAGGRGFLSLEAGGDHTCGLTTDEERLCWGRNDVGELGIGSPFTSPVPQALDGGPYDEVHAGFYQSCGSLASGALECWGASRWAGSLPIVPSADCPGYYGAFEWECARSPVPLSSGFTFEQVDIGLFFGCGIATGGQAMCWGMNDYGQLGSEVSGQCTSNGTVRPCAPEGVVVAAGAGLRGVSAGDVHACGVDLNDEAYCWGSALFSFGELGAGADSGSVTPVRVATEERFRSVRASKGNTVGSHTCGLTLTGEAWCWGYNATGGLGAVSSDACSQGGGTVDCALTPVPVSGARRFSSLVLGRQFTCGLVEDNSAVYCWGINDLGQLGDGSSASRVEPGPVLLPTP